MKPARPTKLPKLEYITDKAVAEVIDPKLLTAYEERLLKTGSCLHYDDPNNESICDLCFGLLYHDPNIVDFRFKNYKDPTIDKFEQ